jgi:protein involved in sex pheromone biosynthesis
MKKILISLLLLITIIFAGCSSETQDTNIEVDVDVEEKAQEQSVEESIDEDFSEEVEDIEIGELI